MFENIFSFRILYRCKLHIQNKDQLFFHLTQLNVIKELLIRITG